MRDKKQELHDLRAAVRTLRFFYEAVKDDKDGQKILTPEKDRVVQEAIAELEHFVQTDLSTSW